METADPFGIGFFVGGNYHLLCREGSGYRFRVIEPHGGSEPAEFTYHQARRFIETHPVCANISRHDIRVMSCDEVQNILLGRSPESTVKSLTLSSEEAVEERLH